MRLLQPIIGLGGTKALKSSRWGQSRAVCLRVGAGIEALCLVGNVN